MLLHLVSIDSIASYCVCGIEQYFVQLPSSPCVIILLGGGMHELLFSQQQILEAVLPSEGQCQLQTK